MQYVKTIDLWDESVASLIRQGALKLQRGQWVRCGRGRRSRLVDINSLSKTVWAVHPTVSDSEKGPDTRQWIKFLSVCIPFQEKARRGV